MLNCTILFQNPTMPNRSCDFCLNDYKKEPNVGYFKFSDYMKIKLDMTEVKADFICGLHFDKNSFLKNGRLTSTALPTFFPSLVNLEHDHPYCQAHGEDQQHCEIGNMFIYKCVETNLTNSRRVQSIVRTSIFGNISNTPWP